MGPCTTELAVRTAYRRVIAFLQKFGGPEFVVEIETMSFEESCETTVQDDRFRLLL